MTKFTEAIESSQQKTGEFWQNAYDLLQGHSDPKFVESVDGESLFIATPSIRPADIQGIRIPAGDEEAYEQRYAVAARSNDKKLDPSDVLYLVVNDNFADPVLRFHPGMSGLVTFGGAFSEIEDGHKYVPTILDAIKTQDETKVSNALAERRHTRARRFRGVRNTVAGIAAVAAIGGGIAAVVINGNNETARQAQELADFDNRDLMIDTETVSAAEVGYVESDPDFFDQFLPAAGQQEGFSDPRTIKLGSTSCSTITTLDPATQAVRMVTDAPDEKMFVAVNSQGKVQVCFSDGAIDANIAVQVVDKPLS